MEPLLILQLAGLPIPAAYNRATHNLWRTTTLVDVSKNTLLPFLSPWRADADDGAEGPQGTPWSMMAKMGKAGTNGTDGDNGNTLCSWVFPSS